MMKGPASHHALYSLLEPEVTGLEEGPEQVGRGVGSSEPMDRSGQGAGVGKREGKGRVKGEGELRTVC